MSFSVAGSALRAFTKPGAPGGHKRGVYERDISILLD